MERDDLSQNSRQVSDVEDDVEDEVQQGSGEDDEGEDLLENMEGDYREMPHLDRYEAEGIDSEFAEDMTEEERQAARLAAEDVMARRDRAERPAGAARLPGALLDDDDDDEDWAERRRRRGRERVERAQAGEEEEEDEELPDLAIDLGALGGRATETITQAPVQREIARRFKRFLKTYQDPVTGEHKYRKRISDMVTQNKQTLELAFVDFGRLEVQLMVWIVDCPKQIFEILDKAAYEVAVSQFSSFPDIHKEVFVRLVDMPQRTEIRNIRRHHLGSMVATRGVVTRRTGVFPQLQMVKYDCGACGFVIGPFFQNTESEIKVGSCPQCQAKGPFSVNLTETVYRNYQKLTLQESPGSVPAGRLPRHKEVVLLHDLIDMARPGEEIEVTGVYVNAYDAALNARQGFPVFSTLIEANSVVKRGDAYAECKLTDEDRIAILDLARQPDISARIVRSIAPSIYGHHNIKTGIALALIGGQEKHPSGSHRLRGDINMLLLGDPGTAKSQFLKYVEKVAPRAVYTTGKGASAVGLTASVQKDPITREWTLEGGALVLADRGVCLIDEFDKMNDQDRVSIHEAMEQQSISISKAGIVTSLQARCSVIAAANPIGGRYDSSRTFAENVELTDPILSRFDILCVVKDVVDPVADERLAEFVVSSHMRSHPHADREAAAAAEAADPTVIPQALLRKYITYAKSTCHPKLQNADYDKIATVYAELRRESALSHGMPIAVRHLESIIRMSEAHAAMHLREYVEDDDVDTAIRVMLDSFVATQKLGVQKALRAKFRRFTAVKRDFHDLIMDCLRGLVRDKVRHDQVAEPEALHYQRQLKIPIRQLEDRVREFGIHDLQPFFGSRLFADAHFSHDAEARSIVLAQ